MRLMKIFLKNETEEKVKKEKINFIKIFFSL